MRITTLSLLGLTSTMVSEPITTSGALISPSPDGCAGRTRLATWIMGIGAHMGKNVEAKVDLISEMTIQGTVRGRGRLHSPCHGTPDHFYHAMQAEGGSSARRLRVAVMQAHLFRVSCLLALRRWAVGCI